MGLLIVAWPMSMRAEQPGAGLVHRRLGLDHRRLQGVDLLHGRQQLGLIDLDLCVVLLGLAAELVELLHGVGARRGERLVAPDLIG